MVASLFWALLWLLVPVVHAAPADAQAILIPDTTTLSLGQTIGVSILVKGAEPAGVPQLPTDGGLAVRFSGQARSVSVINGAVQQETRLRFDMTGTQIGTWTLGPAGVRVVNASGQVQHLSVAAMQITVQAAPDPGDQGQLIVVETGFDTPRAWQGQLVVWHQVVRSRLELASLRWFDTPSDGLLAPRDGRPEEKRSADVDTVGTRFTFGQWIPWLATSAGHFAYNVPAVELDVVVPDAGPGGLLGFFQRTKREVHTAPAPVLDVQPLPPAPPNFSGLVGDFAIESHLRPKDSKVGASIPWTIVLSGNGALDNAKLASFENEQVRVYDNAPITSAALRDGLYHAQARFDRTIVPLKQGEVIVPDVEVVVFSPTQGAYVTLRAKGAKLQVGAGAEVDAALQSFAGPTPEGTELVADDAIRPLTASGPGLVLPFARWMPLTWALAAAPALVLGLRGLAGALAAWWRRRGQALRASKPRRARDILNHLPNEGPERLAALGEALDLAVRDFAIARSLDPALGVGVLPDDTREPTEHAFARLNRARFAGQNVPSDLENEILALIAQIEASP